MVDILQRVGIRSTSTDRVYEALTTIDGLAGWWTTDTQGDGAEGGTLQFRFASGGFDMKVLETRPAEHVRWQVIDGPEEWIGTEVSFELSQAEDFTIILFKHEGWKEPVEFMYHCTTKWAVFLLSLKSLLETGTGSSHPHDVEISDWP